MKVLILDDNLMEPLFQLIHAGLQQTGAKFAIPGAMVLQTINQAPSVPDGDSLNEVLSALGQPKGGKK